MVELTHKKCCFALSIHNFKKAITSGRPVAQSVERWSSDQVGGGSIPTAA